MEEQRYFSDPQGTSDEVFPQTINTICPIEHSDDARWIALHYMTTVEAAVDSRVDQMLRTELAISGSEKATHIFCSREGYCHQARAEAAYLKGRPESWCGRTQYEADSVPIEALGLFCCVVGDVSTLFERLGLREVG